MPEASTNAFSGPLFIFPTDASYPHQMGFSDVINKYINKVLNPCEKKRMKSLVFGKIGGIFDSSGER